MIQIQKTVVITEEYFPHIDVFKGIIILLVIAGHIVQNSLLGGGRDHPLYIWIYLFHMPAFFFCSGFLNKTNDISDFVTAKSYVIKKIYRIFIPYLIWCTIMYFYSQKQTSLNSLVCYMLLRPGYGLWFLQALFKFSILSLILMLLINKNIIWRGGKSRGMIITLCVCIAISILGKLPFLIDWNFVWFFFGMILRQSSKFYNFFINKWTATILATIFFASINFDVNRHIISLTGMITILNISLIKFEEGKVIYWLKKFGKNTMPIFLLHFFLLGKYKLIFPIDNLVVVFAILMLISILMAFICLAVYRVLSFGYLPRLLWGDKIASQMS